MNALPEVYTTSDTFEQRFWANVDMSADCWLWTGATDRDGYGRFHVTPFSRDCSYLAHRISWAITNELLPSGVCVCHTCDNPLCVRPSHLFIGAVADNHADKQRKGRARNGWTTNPEKMQELVAAGRMKNKRWRIPDEVRDEARKLHQEGLSQVQIGKRLGVGQATVSAIVREAYQP